MKPTRDPTWEQIEQWGDAWYSSGIKGVSRLQYVAELAYAAGRKAGMEEAQQCCRDMRAQFDAEAGLLQASGASYCIEAIDAAMEADNVS